MIAVGGVDQLARDTNAIVGFAHAALEDVPHAQLGGHVAHVDGLALVGERGVAGDDEEPSLSGETRDDVFGETIRKIFLVRIAAHVLEGEYGDRRLIRERQRLCIRHEFGCLVRRRRR
jgi:hypothetical protein